MRQRAQTVGVLGASPRQLVCLGLILLCGRTPDAPRATLTVEERWATRGSAAIGEFVGIGGMAEATDGRIWVSDSRPGRIVALDSSGRGLGVLAASGDGPGELRGPARITRTPTGEMAVHDVGRRAIEVFDRSGRYRRRIALRYTIENPKGFAALPAGGFIISGGIAGQASAIHRFSSDGNLEASWHPIPVTRNPRAGRMVAGGPIAVRRDGLVLFSQAAPHRILLFSPGDTMPHQVAADPTLLPAVGDDFIVERMEDGAWVRSFRWLFPQSRAVFWRDDQTILNVVLFAEQGRTIWQLYDQRGRLLAAHETARSYFVWALADNGDVLGSYVDLATGQFSAVRLAVRNH